MNHINKQRPLSWSQISSFEYSPEQWYKRYILKEQDKPSVEMLFGKEVGVRYAIDPTFHPEVPRLEIFEHRLLTQIEGLPLVGYVDSLSMDRTKLIELKTGKKAWTQKRADTHGQITMYLLMLYLMEDIKPESVTCYLHWLPTEESMTSMNDSRPSISFVEPFRFHTFETKRTLRECLEFGANITNVLKEMQEYLESKVDLSTRLLAK